MGRPPRRPGDPSNLAYLPRRLDAALPVFTSATWCPAHHPSSSSMALAVPRGEPCSDVHSWMTDVAAILEGA
jgi:hypothetical protein